MILQGASSQSYTRLDHVDSKMIRLRHGDKLHPSPQGYKCSFPETVAGGVSNATLARRADVYQLYHALHYHLGSLRDHAGNPVNIDWTSFVNGSTVFVFRLDGHSDGPVEPMSVELETGTPLTAEVSMFALVLGHSSIRFNSDLSIDVQ